jgi:hypothetical protein
VGKYEIPKTYLQDAANHATDDSSWIFRCLRIFEHEGTDNVAAGESDSVRKADALRWKTHPAATPKKMEALKNDFSAVKMMVKTTV